MANFTIIIVATLMLAGCSTTIIDDSEVVTVKRTAPALLVSMTKVVQDALEAAKNACEERGQNAEVVNVEDERVKAWTDAQAEALKALADKMNDKESESERPSGLLRNFSFWSRIPAIAKDISTAKKGFDDAGSLLNSVFGTHGYTATVKCEVP